MILETTGRMDAYRDADVRHVAQWDPARVLAEVEAKRRIVDLHSGGLDSLGRPLTVHIDQDVPEQPACLGCNFDNDEEYRYAVDECPTKRLLALPYRDHPDYDPAWAQGAQER